MVPSFTAHPLGTIALVLFFEELGVPIPIPGDVMMLLAGIQAAQGVTSLWMVLLIQEVVTVAGAGILYLVSRRLGRTVALEYGRYVGLTPARLGFVERKLEGRARTAVVVGRLVPGTRVLTPIAAGIVGVPAGQFFPALALGAFIYLTTYTMIGYWVGPRAVEALERIAIPVSSVLALVALAGVALAIRAVRRSGAATVARTHPTAAHLAAGLAAGVAGLLAATVANGVASAVAGPSSETFRLGTSVAGPARVILGWPLFLGAAMLLALLADRLRSVGWRASLRVALVAGAPLLATLLILDPLTEAAALPAAPGATALLALASLIRWGTYAAVLATVGPILAPPEDARETVLPTPAP